MSSETVSTGANMNVQMVPNPTGGLVAISCSFPVRAQSVTSVLDVAGIAVMTQDLGIQQKVVSR